MKCSPRPLPSSCARSTATTQATSARSASRQPTTYKSHLTGRAEGRAVVTENVADYAAERDLVLVFVLKKNLHPGSGQAAALAKALDRWAHDQPEPY
jgi:hypothetical protein